MDSFSSASSLGILERLNPDDFAGGSVNIVDVSAIRDHSPSSWPRRQQQVADYIMRSFRRRARDSDIILQLDEVRFILAQPGAPRAIAIACCGNVARETLGYFLGSNAPADVQVLLVSGMTGGAVQAAAIDQAELTAAISGAEAGEESRSTALDGPKWEAMENQLSPPKSVCVEISPKTEAALRLDPIWSIRQNAVVSFLVVADIMREEDGRPPCFVRLSELEPKTALTLAVEMLDYAMAAIAAGAANGQRFGIHLPIGIAALTTSRERLALARRLQAIDPADRALLVLELAECASGMPQSRLIDLVSAARPFCRAVVARVEGGLMPPRDWRSTGLSGLAVAMDIADSVTELTMMERFKVFAQAAAGQRTLIVAHGLRRRGLVLSAWSEGFTHVSGQVISDESTAGTRAIRLTGVDIFAPDPVNVLA